MFPIIFFLYINCNFLLCTANLLIMNNIYLMIPKYILIKPINQINFIKIFVENLKILLKSNS